MRTPFCTCSDAQAALCKQPSRPCPPASLPPCARPASHCESRPGLAGAAGTAMPHRECTVPPPAGLVPGGEQYLLAARSTHESSLLHDSLQAATSVSASPRPVDGFSADLRDCPDQASSWDASVTRQTAPRLVLHFLLLSLPLPCILLHLTIAFGLPLQSSANLPAKPQSYLIVTSVARLSAPRTAPRRRTFRLTGRCLVPSSGQRHSQTQDCHGDE